jgi:signal transduction histidine kinase
VVVLLIGVVIALEYFTGVTTRFDSLLFPRSLLTNVRYPGRPAPLTAFEFILLGAACLFLPVRQTVAIVFREFSAVITITLAYLALLEYLRAGISRDGAISPVGVALSALIAFAILIVAPERRLVPLIGDPGTAGILVRRLLPVPFALTLLSTVVRIGLERWRGYNPQAGATALGAINFLAALAIVWGCSNSVLRFDRARRRAEEELHQQQANALLGSIVQACPLAVCALNLDGSLRKSNAAADAMGLWAIPDCRRLAQRALQGEPVTGIEVTIAANSKEQYLSVWASPLPGPEGAPDGAVIIAVDTSERRALEEQIQQNQHLESLGVLAGGIAHDFNNLLTGVMGHASMLHEHFQPDSPGAASVHSLIDASQHMAKLTAQMLAYSGKGRYILEPLDLSRQVVEIGDLLQSSVPKNVCLHQNLAQSLPHITADAGQVQQAIMNLVVNGAEAVGEQNGRVELSTETRRVEAIELDRSVVRPPPPPGDYVILTVRDNGPGMDDDTKARIFEPFFTTKFAGRGLGLSAVLGIVRAHHGALTINSQLAAGATFRVYFPVTPAATPPRDGVASCAP